MRLDRLLTYRLIATAVVIVATTYFFYSAFENQYRQFFIVASTAAFLFLALEWLLIRSILTFGMQLLTQFGLDLLLVSVLVMLTGGIQSPFVFLFGLIIVAAGTQSHVLVVLVITVMACICYLSSIHLIALFNEIILRDTERLHILLQTSALFLVGGVMAAIARRYASLQQESSHAVREHRQLKELYEQVVSSMQEGIVVLDQEFNVQDSNEPAHRLLSLDRSSKRLRLEDIDNVPKKLLDFLRRVDAPLFQCEWTTRAGLCLVTAAQLPGDDPFASWVLTLVDITDVRTLERRLAEQDKLAAMGRMVAMLAHEIRNPLQTLGQSVELIGSVHETRQADIQRIVAEEVHRLNRLVSDMLDFVQPLSPDPAEVSCAELIGSSVAQVDMNEQYHVAWQCDVEKLVLDPDHFRLVLDNLLRNAVEASPEAESVEIRLRRGGDEWLLSISDQGGGISQEMRDHLFEPFATGKTSGIGLGLATVWQVCQVNGWHVKIEEIPGGCRFMIRGRVPSHG